MEKRGIPCAVIVHDKFGAAARAQARSLGYPNLNIIEIAQPKPGRLDPEDEAKKAEQTVDRVVAALTQAVPQPA